MQNTSEVETSASNGMVPSTKGAVSKKGVDVSIRKVILQQANIKQIGTYSIKPIHEESNEISGWKV